jgi:hypothetical protein
MAADESAPVDARLLTYLEQRSVQVTEAEFLAYVLGVKVDVVKAALRRLETAGRIRINAAGQWTAS